MRHKKGLKHWPQVLSAEFLVDWIKHAFITRFNEVSAEVYKDYTTYLAYDLAQTKQKHVGFESFSIFTL
jgi:Eukaryotic membrane protein family